MKMTLLIGMLALFQQNLIASPIRDDQPLQQRVTWHQSNQTSCFKVCDQKRAVAEHSRLNNTEYGGTFVCRGYDRDLAGWVYGNNLYRENDRGRCKAVLPSGKRVSFDVFKCLCVLK